MSLKHNNQPLDVAWEQLEEGKCFFVRCLDPEAEEKKIRARGYLQKKKIACTRIGILDGFLGVLCFRSNRTTDYEVSSPTLANTLEQAYSE